MTACPTPASAGRLRDRHQNAFTLVEVAVAAAILALVLTTAITTLQRAFSQLDTARNLSIASTILQTEMENERLFTWAKLTDSTYQPSIGAVYLREPSVAGRFALSRSVAMLANHSDQTLQVTLTVRWRSFDGRTISRSYSTYFTKGGLNDFYYGSS